MVRSAAHSHVTYVDDESLPAAKGKVVDFHTHRHQSGSRQRSRSAQSSRLPIIYTANQQLRDVADQALRALYEANSPTARLFVHAGKLAVIAIDPSSGMALIHCLGADALRDEMSRAADYFSTRGKGRRAVSPPMDVVKNILSRPSWTLPPLAGVTSIPVLRADGTICDQPGYDIATRLFYQPTPHLIVPPVSEAPTDDEVQAAVAVIDDIICDFPYATSVDRAHAFALMLTPFIRPLVDIVPLALIEAPKQGTGKSLHVDIVAIIVTGDLASMTSAPTREDEWIKTLAGLLLDGRPLVALDNLEGTLNSSALASVLTSQTYGPRLLGTMTAVNARNDVTWVGTANNVRLGPDLARRCYWIRLDAKTMRPELRQGFRHPNLKVYTKQHRGQVVHALLTLARGWFAAGQPVASTSLVMGSFEQWATTVGGILEYAGIEGFLSNLSEKREQVDEETGQWAGFFSEWERTFGDRPVLVSTIAADMKRNSMWTEYLSADLIRAFRDETHSGSFSKKLGKALGDQVDRRYTEDGLRLVRGGKEQHCQLWRVVRDQTKEGM